MGELVTLEEAVALGVYETVNNGPETEYVINMSAAKVHAPELYYAELNAIDEAILAAIEAGYIELDFTIDEDGNLNTTYNVLKDFK